LPAEEMAQTFSALNLILKLLFHISLVVLFVNGKRSSANEKHFIKQIVILISFFCVFFLFHTKFANFRFGKINWDFIVRRFAGHGQSTETFPEFLAPLDNLTVTQGRDISFTCVVNNLGQYRVSIKWL
jgi:hypothetical protein